MEKHLWKSLPKFDSRRSRGLKSNRFVCGHKAIAWGVFGRAMPSCRVATCPVAVYYSGTDCRNYLSGDHPAKLPLMSPLTIPIRGNSWSMSSVTGIGLSGHTTWVRDILSLLTLPGTNSHSIFGAVLSLTAIFRILRASAALTWPSLLTVTVSSDQECQS